MRRPSRQRRDLVEAVYRSEVLPADHGYRPIIEQTSLDTVLLRWTGRPDGGILADALSSMGAAAILRSGPVSNCAFKLNRGVTCIVGIAAALCGLLALSLAPSTSIRAYAAGASPSCTGWSGCSQGGYTTHGYQAHEGSQYWGSVTGNECTNYTAYVEQTVYGVAAPKYSLGNAGSWASNASSHNVPVNGQPSTGSIAQWNYNAGVGMLYGHVAIVEAVAADGSWIKVSQQDIAGVTDGYDWQIVYKNNALNSKYQPWPSNFIHFVAAGAVTDGTFVSAGGSVYRIAGGAPIYVSSWSVYGGAQPVTVLTQAQFNALPQVPADGTFISAGGSVYRTAGGAPIYVSSWSVYGGPQPVTVEDPVAVTNAGQSGAWAHLNAVPADGTFISAGGSVYRTAGGAPIYVSSWSVYGGPQPVTVEDPVAVTNAGQSGAWAHLNAVPADGTFISAGGSVYRIAGGVPQLASEAGGPTAGQTVTAVDPLAITKAGDGIPFNNLLRPLGDLSLDGFVGCADRSILMAHWGMTSATLLDGDLNGDGVVNSTDLSILLSHWAPPPSDSCN
jgi:surface antigen